MSTALRWSSDSRRRYVRSELAEETAEERATVLRDDPPPDGVAQLERWLTPVVNELIDKEDPEAPQGPEGDNARQILGGGQPGAASCAEGTAAEEGLSSGRRSSARLRVRARRAKAGSATPATHVGGCVRCRQ